MVLPKREDDCQGMYIISGVFFSFIINVTHILARWFLYGSAGDPDEVLPVRLPAQPDP